jgi:hypothetical protein
MSSLSPGNEVSFTLLGSSSRTIISVIHGELSATCSYNEVIVSSISESWGGGEICRSSSYYDVYSESGDSSCTRSSTIRSERTYCERGGINFIGFSSLTRKESRTWAPGCFLWGEYGYTNDETWTRRGILELPELPQDCPNGAYILEGNGFSYEGGSNAPSFLSGSQCRDRGGSPYPPQPKSCTYEQSQSCSGTFHDMVAGRTDGKTRYPFPSPGGPPQTISCHSQDPCVTWVAETTQINFTTNNPFGATRVCGDRELYRARIPHPDRSQRGKRPPVDRLPDTPGNSISRKGCAVTVFCAITPDCDSVEEMNELLSNCKKYDCFDENGNLKWKYACKEIGCEIVRFVDAPLDLNTLWNEYLKPELDRFNDPNILRFVIIRLHYIDPSSGDDRYHFVILYKVIGSSDGVPKEYRVYDPARDFGQDGYNLQDYLNSGKDISGIRIIEVHKQGGPQ